MSDAIWIALALLLVLEGLMPAINPAGWRRMFEQLLRLSDQQVRAIGLISMVAGLIMLWLIQMGD
ncbi:hypothetical protein JY96_02210 [Aquabacterium sp. NJ1]|uniref:DUF2065 domain-containing protein n=1 Tax=Aquabacterium sp. NJ1 TaxID=1538295 RepID=UPI00052D59ED|nr:DUF2065 family protein [Aquabacterium sp. NJ1]KGM39237.1 hypothetical protein JY96_02210 [Aquabacterium sp. NJ1]